MEFRNLEIHYLEEEPNGVRVVDLKGSSVHALVFPRNEFNKARDVAKLRAREFPVQYREVLP